MKAVHSFALLPPQQQNQRMPFLSTSSSSLAASSEATDADTKQQQDYTTTTSNEIIPREILFGNPKVASPAISPDGNFLAYLAPSVDKGVLNVFVRQIVKDNEDEEDRMVTNDELRGIRRFFWAEDSKTLMYYQDEGGNENFHLWAIDATAKGDAVVARDLTPGDQVKVSNVLTSKYFPNEILLGTNQRDASVFDMYRCHYNQQDDPELIMDTQNPGNVVGWGINVDTFQILEATVRNPQDSSNTIRIRKTPQDEWKDFITYPYGDEGGMVDFCRDNKTCLMTSSIGRETTALLRIDLETGEEVEEIFYNPQCDCSGIVLDEETRDVRGVSYTHARTERVFFDDELKKDYETLASLGPDGAEIGVGSRTRDEKTWVVSYTQSDGPTEYVLYNQENKTIEPLFCSRPELLNYKLAKMEDVIITARDGLKLVAYLTRAKMDEPTPLVLLVHGGPWARDYWGYNAMAQWFANRGYATLQVNYRGSTGYGKSFLHKGDRQWGVGTMQHDLSDSVQWAIEQGIADKDKICIFGGSYGGYACLAGLTFTPELYCCGVDIVGPSNVKTLLDSIPPYWGPIRNQMLLQIGDVDADAEFNKKISPLFHVDNIRAPLLIGQGANDPRVKQAEADQIAFSMQSKGIPVEYVLYPDEGHGFARPENRIDFNGRTELFLQTHLGGRAQEFEPVEGATAAFPLLKEGKEDKKE